MSNTPLRRKNIRTALAFLSVAVTFFVGVLAAHLLGSDHGGLTILGFAVVTFLVIAIGRTLKSRS
ncbi:MAG: hypothetical protein ABIS17_10130 [Casimicrobiaceae bacterium]